MGMKGKSSLDATQVVAALVNIKLRKSKVLMQKVMDLVKLLGLLHSQMKI